MQLVAAVQCGMKDIDATWYCGCIWACNFEIHLEKGTWTENDDLGNTENVRSVSGIQKGAQFHTLHLILLGQINKTF
jgi:hypothetical protein